MSLHGCHQVMQYRSLLQPQRLDHRQHALHKTTTLHAPTPLGALRGSKPFPVWIPLAFLIQLR